MRTFSFRIIIADQTIATEEMADAIYGAGIDDGLFGSSEGVVSVAMDREAESMELAVTSTVRQIREAGFDVQRIELDHDEVESLMAS